jgi:histidinol-phosphate aminotransferase
VPVQVPLGAGERHDLAAMAAAITPRTRMVLVCTPNNPTGTVVGDAELEVFLEQVPSDVLVVIDEAYVEFVTAPDSPDALAIHRSRPNVAVLRTFSKAFALAGARLGYGMVSEAVASDIKRVRLPYHVSSLTQAAGLAALRHGDEAMAILDAIRHQRDRIARTLSEIEGLEVFPSDANFVLFRGAFSPGRVWEALLDHGVLVRDLSMVVPGCLRVTAGTPEETTAFLDALRAVLADSSSGPEHRADGSESW